MIRTEIDITNPQKVEVIKTGEIGYVTMHIYGRPGNMFRVDDKTNKHIGWYNAEELRAIEDEKLVFDVDIDALTIQGSNVLLVAMLEDVGNKDNYTYQVIATPKEKSLEDMTKEELIEMVKQLKK